MVTLETERWRHNCRFLCIRRLFILRNFVCFILLLLTLGIGASSDSETHSASDSNVGLSGHRESDSDSKSVKGSDAKDLNESTSLVKNPRSKRNRYDVNKIAAVYLNDFDAISKVKKQFKKSTVIPVYLAQTPTSSDFRIVDSGIVCGQNSWILRVKAHKHDPTHVLFISMGDHSPVFQPLFEQPFLWNSLFWIAKEAPSLRWSYFVPGTLLCAYPNKNALFLRGHMTTQEELSHRSYQSKATTKRVTKNNRFESLMLPLQGVSILGTLGLMIMSRWTTPSMFTRDDGSPETGFPSKVYDTTLGFKKRYFSTFETYFDETTGKLLEDSVPAVPTLAQLGLFAQVPLALCSLAAILSSILRKRGLLYAVVEHPLNVSYKQSAFGPADNMKGFEAE